MTIAGRTSKQSSASRSPRAFSVFDQSGERICGRDTAARPAGVLVSYAFAGRPGHMVADTVRVRVGEAQRSDSGEATALCMVPRELKSDHGGIAESAATARDGTDGDIRAEVGAVFPLREAARCTARSNAGAYRQGRPHHVRGTSLRGDQRDLEIEILVTRTRPPAQRGRWVDRGGPRFEPFRPRDRGGAGTGVRDAAGGQRQPEEGER